MVRDSGGGSIPTTACRREGAGVRGREEGGDWGLETATFGSVGCYSEGGRGHFGRSDGGCMYARTGGTGCGMYIIGAVIGRSINVRLVCKCQMQICGMWE